MKYTRLQITGDYRTGDIHARHETQTDHEPADLYDRLQQSARESSQYLKVAGFTTPEGNALIDLYEKCGTIQRFVYTPNA